MNKKGRGHLKWLWVVHNSAQVELREGGNNVRGPASALKRVSISSAPHVYMLSEASEKSTTGSPGIRSIAAFTPMFLSSKLCHQVPWPDTAAASPCLWIDARNQSLTLVHFSSQRLIPT